MDRAAGSFNVMSLGTTLYTNFSSPTSSPSSGSTGTSFHTQLFFLAVEITMKKRYILYPSKKSITNDLC